MRRPDRGAKCCSAITSIPGTTRGCPAQRRPGRPPAQQSDITMVIRMEPTGQHNEKSLARGIDPEHRPGVSGVTVGVQAEFLLHVGVVGEAISQPRPRRTPPGSTTGPVISATVSRFRIPSPPAEQHLGESGNIVSGRENPGVTSDASHAICGRSCTSPQRNLPFCRSVGTIRACSASAGRNSYPSCAAE